MPNLNTPFGLRPVRHRSGAPYNGTAQPYFVPASYATALFIGDPVVKTGTSNTARVSAPGIGTFDIGTLPEINRATAGATNRITGVVVGFAANPDGLSTKHNPASTARIVYVADDPDLLFECQIDTATPATSVGLNANLIFTQAGSTYSGWSGVEINGATPAVDATFQLILMRAVNRDDNDTVAIRGKWECTINLHTERVSAIAGI